MRKLDKRYNFAAFKKRNDFVAQLVEQLTLNQRAGSSSLPGVTKEKPLFIGFSFFMGGLSALFFYNLTGFTYSFFVSYLVNIHSFGQCFSVEGGGGGKGLL